VTVLEAPPRRRLGAELVRPRSLLLLLVALAVALLFAALGQWQLQRAVQNGAVVARPTESIRPLASVATPQTQQTDASIGQMVRVSGSWVPGDFLVVDRRLNRGTEGAWVAGHFLPDRPAGSQLAVAVGWAPDRAHAQAVADRLNARPPARGALVGRYLDSDGAVVPQSGPPTALTAMAVPQLLNLWQRQADGPVYNGYVVARAAPAGLTAIDSPRPTKQVELNLLNLLYAGEWVVFALAAFYVWYRLIRDRWERLGAPEGGPEDVAEGA
jgi:cytochrome oxidase assembly protein ShyY1